MTRTARRTIDLRDYIEGVCTGIRAAHVELAAEQAREDGWTILSVDGDELTPSGAREEIEAGEPVVLERVEVLDG